MPGLFKPSYCDKKTGKTKRCLTWWAWWRDNNGRTHRQNTGCRDKSAANAWLTSKITRMEHERVGIASPYEDAAQRPLAEHLDDWERFLAAKSRPSKRYQRNVIMVVGRARLILMERAEFKRIGDIRPNRVAEIVASFRASAPRTANGHISTRSMSARTMNGYLKACKQFSRWLHHQRRWNEDILASLSGYNERVDRRHDRRALDSEEIRWLLDTVKTAGVDRGLSGEDRYAIYLLALNSGLRLNELASLTPSSFDFKTNMVRILASCAKNARTTDQPVKASVMEFFCGYLNGKNPYQLIWGSQWTKRAARMLRRDLARAREDSGKGGDFLAYKNAAGEYADFHSLRHTYGSMLLRAGVNIKVVQSLMRHSTITLTMNVYGHVGLFDLSVGAEALPEMGRGQAKRTA